MRTARPTPPTLVITAYCGRSADGRPAVNESPQVRAVSHASCATTSGTLHQHPELSHQEHRTAARVAERLRAIGFSVHEGIGGTGVVGVLGNGDGPTVLLRADMDALPVKEATGLPYASTTTATDAAGGEVPVMHSCGHDVLVTCLLGAAQLLAEGAEYWSGTATHRSSRHTQPTRFRHAETALLNQRRPGWSTGPAAGRVAAARRLLAVLTDA